MGQRQGHAVRPAELLVSGTGSFASGSDTDGLLHPASPEADGCLWARFCPRPPLEGLLVPPPPLAHTPPSSCLSLFHLPGTLTCHPPIAAPSLSWLRIAPLTSLSWNP